MHRRSMIAAFVLGLMALSASTVHAGSLTGTVKNSTTLGPLSGADITVHVLIPDSIPFPTSTAPDGSYEITGIIPGNEIYVVIAWMSGFRQSYTRVADLGSQDLVFDILLEPDTAGLPPPGGGGDSGNVSGTIYEVGTGGGLQGVPNATVTLYAGGGTTVTSSGTDGAYSARIPSGPYTIAVSGSGFDSLALTGLSVDSLGATVNAVVKKTITDVDEDDPAIPLLYALGQNYPNPFNPVTRIGYALPAAGYVRLSVFNLLGQEVAVLVDGLREAGYRTVSFDAAGLPGGVYVYRITAGSFSEAKKMLVLK
ncbi:MAG TPA: T9SS type A sorting domain-containing protein [Bacteroidota bacterium]|nr:T9SS type A sorting domain-containing protein [Bacteroidota bacterium]